jgi:hypothetical protein
MMSRALPELEKHAEKAAEPAFAPDEFAAEKMYKAAEKILLTSLDMMSEHVVGEFVRRRIRRMMRKTNRLLAERYDDLR